MKNNNSATGPNLTGILMEGEGGEEKKDGSEK